MHYDVPLSWIVLSGEETQSAQLEEPEVPTTSEPFSCSVRVLAAVTDCHRTEEAIVDDIPLFFFPLYFLHLIPCQSRPIKVLPPSCKSLGT